MSKIVIIPQIVSQNLKHVQNLYSYGLLVTSCSKSSREHGLVKPLELEVWSSKWLVSGTLSSPWINDAMWINPL